MSLRALVKQSKVKETLRSKESVVNLYRSVIKELPRVMAIYDVDMPVEQATKAINFHFQKHAKLEDERVIGLLISKGYMELEETLKQWKQKTHLLRILEPVELTKGFKQEAKKTIDPDTVPKELADAINSGNPIAFSKFFASVSEDEAEKWMNVLCATKAPAYQHPVPEAEDEHEAFTFFKSAFTWDPAKRLVARGSITPAHREQPISMRSKFYYN